MPTDALPAATRAGADLRLARERLGWGLPDIAAGLRIHLCHLEALEQGRIALLPGNAYVVGYVRSYARAVGLDAEEMVRRFKAEAAEVGRRTKLVFPAPMPDRGLPAGAVVLLGLVLSVGAYTGWYRLSGEGRLPAEAVTAIPERLAPLAEQALPPAANPVADTAVRPAPWIASAAATNVVPAPPVPPISPISAAAAPVSDPVPDQVFAPAAPATAGVTSAGTATTLALAALAPSSPTPGALAAPVPDTPSLATPEPGVQAMDASRIVLHANADAWIQVKVRSGSTLLNRTMKAGETWPVPPQDNLLLTTGNAGGTEILLDGVATPSLGSSGSVRRDMPLDPDLIRDGKLSGSLAPQLVSARARQ